MKIERRVRDRGEDSASRRLVWKFVGLAVLATIVILSLLMRARSN